MTNDLDHDDIEDCDETEGSCRPVRSLIRGLETLCSLGGRSGATVSEVAKTVKLPRTTIYRVLKTLCATGLVVRDSNDRYHPTAVVRSLSGECDDEVWVHTIAKPMIHALGKEVVWPLLISTPRGSSMLVRATTDTESPLALQRYSAGSLASFLGTSSGRLYLALSGDEQREAILDILSRSERPEDKLARDKPKVKFLLAAIRKNGWALSDNAMLAQLNLAVPIIINGRMWAALVMRFIRSAVTSDQVVEKYIPVMSRTALEIGNAIEASAYEIVEKSRNRSEKIAI